MRSAQQLIPTSPANAWASFALVLVALGSAWAGFRGQVPATNFALWSLLALFVLVAMAASVSSFQFSSPGLRARERLWAGVAEGVNWLVWAAVQGVIWLLMPWGGVDRQLVTLLFCTGYMAANLAASLDAPLRSRARILSVTASLVLVAVIHRPPLWPMIVLYLFGFGLFMAILATAADRSIAALRRAQAEAEAASEARSAFMAAAGHDLGQPLQAAKLFFEQAVNAPDPSRRAVAVSNARSAFGAMERLTRQVLDHLRIEAGAASASSGAVELQPVIRRNIDQFSGLAILCGVELKSVATSLFATGDADLLDRALGNLIDNALRHARAGRVLVGACRRGAHVRLWVVDDGRGLSEAALASLFQPFAITRRTDRTRAGLGIGLSSAHGLMDAMNGRCGVDLRWLHGAAFYLELPMHS